MSTRKAGQSLTCPKCAGETVVPLPEAKVVTEDIESEPPKRQHPLPPTRELPATSENDPRDVNAWAPTQEIRQRPERDFAETAPILQPAEDDREPPPRPERLFPESLDKTPAVPSDEEDEFSLRRPRTELEEMDLTPMVDVTFLLLIFFMITASFSLTKAIETPAPDPENQGATIQNLEELEMTSIMVRIDDQDAIFIDDEPVSDPSMLEDLFGDKLRAEQKNEVVIQASLLSRHETFVSVFDAATGAGMQKIRLAAVSGED